MNNSVLAQIVALPEKSTPELKQLWRDLYDREPPPYNKPFLIKRLAYRIQELAYGGLSARAEAKLKALIDEEDRRVKGKQPVRKGDRPIAGTRLIREWQGVEHCATVIDDGFEYQGRRYRSLSAIARAITGTRWNGPLLGTPQSPEGAVTAPVRKVRCAVYTRKSSEEGLEMEFNSLDAQCEAALAYIQSQKHEGWILVGDRYDDGGFSGGSIERPALQRLLRDVEAGRIDVIVVYKVDRLSRSLTDFARIVEVFEKNKASFVSVTQQFNTTTSMGRLTLNILLSFAQFEREVIGERIRDKFAASRRKGMWMGGIPPLGYDVRDRKLVVNEGEAELVRRIFQRFLRVGSATKLVRELVREGYRTKSWTTQDGKYRPGKAIDKGAIYKILANRTYLGEAVHKGTNYPGEHEAIIERATWDRVHAILAEKTVARANGTRAQTPARMAW